MKHSESNMGLQIDYNQKLDFAHTDFSAYLGDHKLLQSMLGYDPEKVASSEDKVDKARALLSKAKEDSVDHF
jgi:hypothetical protein